VDGVKTEMPKLEESLHKPLEWTSSVVRSYNSLENLPLLQ